MREVVGSTPRPVKINRVANSSQSLRCFFGAALSRRKAAEMDYVARYTFRCNSASIMEIFCGADYQLTDELVTDFRI